VARESEDGSRLKVKAMVQLLLTAKGKIRLGANKRGDGDRTLVFGDFAWRFQINLIQCLLSQSHNGHLAPHRPTCSGIVRPRLSRAPCAIHSSFTPLAFIGFQARQTSLDVCKLKKESPKQNRAELRGSDQRQNFPTLNERPQKRGRKDLDSVRA